MPRGDPLQLGGEFSANVVKVLGWANDPAILQSNMATVLLAEGLHDLNELVVENPHSAKLKIPLPDETEMSAYLQTLVAGVLLDAAVAVRGLRGHAGRRLTGLSRVGARTLLALALKQQRTITSAWLSRTKKDMIERECQGLLEFVESPYHPGRRRRPRGGQAVVAGGCPAAAGGACSTPCPWATSSPAGSARARPSW